MTTGTKIGVPVPAPDSPHRRSFRKMHFWTLRGLDKGLSVQQLIWPEQPESRGWPNGESRARRPTDTLMYGD